MPLVTVAQLGKAINLTPRRVQQLVAEGMPRAERGKYELGACIHWYIRYLQKALEAKASDPGGDGRITSLMSERTRAAREQADRQALENAVRRGELMVAEDAALIFSEAVANLRQALGGHGPRLAKELAGQDEHTILRRLREESNRMLAAMAHALRTGGGGTPTEGDGSGDPGASPG